MLMTHPKHQDVDWVFGFHEYRYVLWGQGTTTVHHLILAETFLIWEKSKHVQLEKMVLIIYEK